MSRRATTTASVLEGSKTRAFSTVLASFQSKDMGHSPRPDHTPSPPSGGAERTNHTDTHEPVMPYIPALATEETPIPVVDNPPFPVGLATPAPVVIETHEPAETTPSPVTDTTSSPVGETDT
ncbi:unnamed protein product, partial [Ectocarpus sp. 12 AP-2014]